MGDERKIENLLKSGERVYLYFSGLDIAKSFMKQAEKEGFLVDGKRNPTECPCACVMEITKEKAIHYVGDKGYEEFFKGTKESGILRIDYRKYIADEKFIK